MEAIKKTFQRCKSQNRVSVELPLVAPRCPPMPPRGITRGDKSLYTSIGQVR